MAQPPASESPSHRLDWLDVVRGIAAVIVYLQHSLERDVAAYEQWSWHWVNFGRVGVTAFFLVSGFVIPFSLERSASLRKFWVSRFFRLYPLYWAAFIAVVLCAASGALFVEQGFQWQNPVHLVVNATMLQSLVRIPNALPVFWTLGLEMLFYWMVSAAFLMKKNQRSLEILYGTGLLVLLAGVATPIVLHREFPGMGGLFLVVTATFGTVFYRYTDGKYSVQQVGWALGFVALVQATLAFVAYGFSEGAPGSEQELIGPSSRFGSAVVGYLLFFGLFAVRHVTFPRFLAYLGLVSYSVYLVHPFVWFFSPKFTNPFLTMALGFVITVALSTLTYRLIEAPFQQLGRSFMKRNDVAEIASHVAP